MTDLKTIRRLRFVGPLPLGIEVMTFDDLRAQAVPGVLSRPLRPDFHSLLLVTGGETTQGVDFVAHRLGPGAALWVRPGQVQRFGDDRAAGDLVLFEADFLIPGTLAAAIADDRFGAATAAGSGSSRSALDRPRRELCHAYARVARSGRTSTTSTETLRHLLSVLILSFDEARPAPGAPTGPHQRFLELLERDFAIAHDVDHYARRLGYSTRTLARATRASSDQSPKQVISSRVVLEARRLLAHTDRPVGTIAREVGFVDPSNFSAFFVRQTGETPTGFRERAAPR